MEQIWNRASGQFQVDISFLISDGDGANDVVDNDVFKYSIDST